MTPAIYTLSPSWLVVELDAPLVELHLVHDDAGKRAVWLDENGLELVAVEVASA